MNQISKPSSMRPTPTARIAALAAKMVVEQGADYGLARRKAARALNKEEACSAQLPSDRAIEDEVRAYISVYCAETQALELAALRALAAQWMQALVEFRPYLTGAVWRGTATRWSSVELELFCDDPKAAEFALTDRHVHFEAGYRHERDGKACEALNLTCPCPALGKSVTLILRVLDHDDLRGGLRSDALGRTKRGDLLALRKLVAKL